MILNFLICVLLAVLILLFATILAEKIRAILEERDYKKMCEQYLAQTGKVLKRIEDLDNFSKRLEKFETDFKTYDELLENRLADIESVVKDWKDTMADAGDSKKPHPKTKPKHLAEKGTEA